MSLFRRNRRFFAELPLCYRLSPRTPPTLVLPGGGRAFAPAADPRRGNHFDTFALVSPADYISVRDWRRKPPLRLRVTQKPPVCWFWIKCTRCPHMCAVAIAPYIIRWVRTAARTFCGKRRGAAPAARGAWRCNTRAGAARTRGGRRCRSIRWRQCRRSVEPPSCRGKPRRSRSSQVRAEISDEVTSRERAFDQIENCRVFDVGSVTPLFVLCGSRTPL